MHTCQFYVYLIFLILDRIRPAGYCGNPNVRFGSVAAPQIGVISAEILHCSDVCLLAEAV